MRIFFFFFFFDCFCFCRIFVILRRNSIHQEKKSRCWAGPFINAEGYIYRQLKMSFPRVRWPEAAPEFFCGGHRGGKMRFWGGKNPKICRKWLILTIFSSDWGASGGQSLQGGQMPPCPPWCRHWRWQKRTVIVCCTGLGYYMQGGCVNHRKRFFLLTVMHPLTYTYSQPSISNVKFRKLVYFLRNMKANQILSSIDFHRILKVSCKIYK